MMESEKIKQVIAKLLRSIYGLECIGHAEMCDLMLQTHAELSEIERLAKIGKATERAFEYLPYMGMIYGDIDEVDGCIGSINELLEWAESED